MEMKITKTSVHFAFSAKYTYKYTRFEVFTVARIHIAIFWVKTLHSVTEDSRSFCSDTETNFSLLPTQLNHFSMTV
jgi:hypothetical protein